MSAIEPNSEARASARPRILESTSPPKSRTRRSASLRGANDPRKHPVHFSPFEPHNRSTIIFVTCCSAKKLPVLASDSVHEAMVGAWEKASTWLVGRYVLLPDHVHFFCAPNGLDAPSLERWMRYWKSLVTRSIGAHGGEVWQRDHWDRQLRRGQSYDEKWEYVQNNPVRHGYVNKPDDWPYQGELHELRW